MVKHPIIFTLRFYWLLLLSTTSILSSGQEATENNLIQKYNEAVTDIEKIKQLGQLAEYFYANKDFEKGDSLIEKQIMLAEATMQPQLILQTYFSNAGYLSTGSATKDRSKNSRTYINRALAYAKATDHIDFVAMANANLAALNYTDGQINEAFKNANLAFTTALNTDNDSAKVICAIQLGNIYQLRSDILMAFKIFTNAQNIGLHPANERLLPPVFHALGKLYHKLKQVETAKNYIHRSLAINKKQNIISNQVEDYIFLAKLNNYVAGKEYLQEAVKLADSIDNVSLKIESEKILFSHMMIQERAEVMMEYLENNPELKNVFINTGPDYINWMLAEIYLYGGQKPDSALYYFKKAENSFSTGYDLSTKKNFFSEYAYCYQLLGNTASAITYYQKLFDLSRAASDLRSLMVCTSELKNLFQQQADYKQAFNYSLLHDNYKDSVDILGRERDFALLEIENVAKQEQREADLAKEKLRRKFNLQYMLITIVVATAFVLMIMIGMFRVSAFTIRLMGFLSLIFFFEFIILILDNWIHHLTHGEPWKIWLIKIGIISFLLPLHHILEHRLIRYLLSRHLITVRSRLSLVNFFRNKKKAVKEKQDATDDSQDNDEVN